MRYVFTIDNRTYHCTAQYSISTVQYIIYIIYSTAQYSTSTGTVLYCSVKGHDYNSKSNFKKLLFLKEILWPECGEVTAHESKNTLAGR